MKSVLDHFRSRNQVNADRTRYKYEILSSPKLQEVGPDWNGICLFWAASLQKCGFMFQSVHRLTRKVFKLQNRIARVTFWPYFFDIKNSPTHLSRLRRLIKFSFNLKTFISQFKYHRRQTDMLFRNSDLHQMLQSVSKHWQIHSTQNPKFCHFSPIDRQFWIFNQDQSKSANIMIMELHFYIFHGYFRTYPHPKYQKILRL